MPDMRSCCVANFYWIKNWISLIWTNRCVCVNRGFIYYIPIHCRSTPSARKKILSIAQPTKSKAFYGNIQAFGTLTRKQLVEHFPFLVLLCSKIEYRRINLNIPFVISLHYIESLFSHILDNFFFHSFTSWSSDNWLYIAIVASLTPHIQKKKKQQ